MTPDTGLNIAVGDAYARDTDDTWEIGNGRVAATFAATTGEPLRLIRLGDGDHAWDTARTGAPFALALAGEPAPRADDLRVRDVHAAVEEGAVRLTIDLAADGLAVTLHVVCHPGQALLRQWLEITPATAATLVRVEPIRLTVASLQPVTLHTVAGVQRQGGYSPESGAYRSFGLEHRALDAPVHLASGLRSTWDETPWGALTAGDGENGGVVVALDYGGRWELGAAPGEAGQTVHAALAPVGLAPEIAAGQTWTAPGAFYGVFDGDLDGAAEVMHDFVRGVLAPPLPDGFPWVQYNTWFSYFCELDAETLLKEADIAADLGVEIFYVDAGWWQGSPHRRDFFSSGLGNWVENRNKFPDGIAAFAGQIRDRGMHFGIWVEPERVDLRTATTGTWQTDWLVSDGGQWAGPDWPPDTDTRWLCFGNAATQDWATEWIGDMVEAYGVRWLKWDSNFWHVCTSTAHDHGPGDGEAAQLAGVYIVMDRLRARFPDLVIENCAGGGTRMDFRLAQHTHTAWMNDASEPAHRSRFHSQGASYLFPPEMLNAWVTESYHENMKRQDLPEPVIRQIVRSRMVGAIGLSCQLVEWSETTRRIVREEIELYKRIVRPLVQTGYVTHPLPQAPLDAPRQPTPGTWEAQALVAADKGSSVAFAFRNVAIADTLTFRMKRLDPDATYRVACEHADRGTMTGRELMERGVEVGCAPLASVVVTLTREDAS
ncbi:MAG TPA: alpha-galactosidase [Thermomicrobiales bacterium]|nr:alpha-galactosidase [Thermomicrobiales bacterium]